MSYDKSALALAYSKFRNFTNYREEEHSKLMSSTSEIGKLVTEIREAQAEKRKVAAECDMRIAIAKGQLATLTGVTGTTDITRDFNSRMRTEKAEVKHAWEREVIRAADAGMSVREITDAVPLLTSSVTIYNILNRSSVAMETETVAVEGGLPTDVKWNYHDHLGVHRYAVSDDRKYVKFHGPHVDDEAVVLTWPDTKYVQGNADLKASFKATKVEDLLSLLDGTYDESRIRLGDNKYRTEE